MGLVRLITEAGHAGFSSAFPHHFLPAFGRIFSPGHRQPLASPLSLDQSGDHLSGIRPGGLFIISGLTTAGRAYRGLAADGGLLLDPQPGSALQPGAGWHQSAPPPAHCLDQHPLHFGFLARHYQQGGVLPFLSAVPGVQRHGALSGHRPFALLPFLGSPTHPHVLPDRHLGPRKAGICRRQICVVHLERQSVNAHRADRPLCVPWAADGSLYLLFCPVDEYARQPRHGNFALCGFYAGFCH